jgi:hypothetical protein
MLDIFNIPNQSDNVKVFYAISASAGVIASQALQVWQKPRGCSYVWMMCIGAGSGGSGGPSGSLAGNVATPGGGSGAVTTVLYAANVLPERLYIQVGLGGSGGTGQSTAAIGTPVAGQKTHITVHHNVANQMNWICTSGTVVASTAGTGETALGIYSFGGSLAALSPFASIGGQTTSTSANITPLSAATVITSAGSGFPGTGTGATPWQIDAISQPTFAYPAVVGGTPGAGTRGRDGYWSWKPMFGTGGAAGSGNTAGVGGNGGNGAFGCGGGAGGPGTFAAGGNGGKGGDGLAIIATF